jgi:hypothetical protein
VAGEDGLPRPCAEPEDTPARKPKQNQQQAVYLIHNPEHLMAGPVSLDGMAVVNWFQKKLTIYIPVVAWPHENDVQLRQVV